MSILRPLLLFVLLTVICACASAQIAFEGFETGTGDWTTLTCGTIARVPSGGGTLGRTSFDGNFHAEIKNCHDAYQNPGYGDSEFSRWGIPPSGTYPGDYAQTISVYIFANWPVPTVQPTLPGFWLDMSPRDSAGMSATFPLAEHNFQFFANGTSVDVKADGVTPIATLTTSGWYTFQMTYRKGATPASPVLTDMKIFDSTGALLGSVPVTNTLTSGNLGGPGYVWFTVWQNGFANDVLAIDDARVDLLTTPAEAFQVSYVSNLNAGDSFINLTNTGSSLGGNGNICANVYAFDPAEELISCCTCLITPNALTSISVRNDLISNTLTPATPTSAVVKLVATTATFGFSTGACNAAALSLTGAPGSPRSPTTGLRAFSSTLHAQPGSAGYDTTENIFQKASLSTNELNRMATLCGFIQANGSGFGICKSCGTGGLGAARR